MTENFSETIRPVQVEKFSLQEAELRQLQDLPRIEVNTRPHEVVLGDVEVFDKNPQTELEQKEILNPAKLLNWVKTKAHEKKVSPWEITKHIRMAGIDQKDFRQVYEVEKRYNETVVYISDIHGGNEAIIHQLEDFAKYPPEALIMTGDVVGTDKFTDLQSLFYNHLNNFSRNKLLKEKPDATNQEILEYAGEPGVTKPSEDFNLKKGLLDIKKFEMKLEGKTPGEIDLQLKSLTDEMIVSEIKRYAKYVHFGHYTSSLPAEIKSGLIGELEENASKLRNVLLAIQEKGTKVAIVEGNWDVRNPLDFEPNTETPIPVKKENRIFNTENYFSGVGIPYFSEIGTLHTGKTLQVLFPFDQITGYPNLSEEKKQELKRQVNQAREDNKQIIFVSHGEPSFKAHHLTDGKTPDGEHIKVVDGMRAILQDVVPDEIVYSHMHNKISIKDSDGMTRDMNNYSMKLNNDPHINVAFIPFDVKGKRSDKNNINLVGIGYKKVTKRKSPDFKPTYISNDLEISI